MQMIVLSQINELKIGDKVFIPGNRNPKEVLKIEVGSVVVKLGKGVCKVYAKELPRVTTLGGAIR